MLPPLDALATISRLPDGAIHRQVALEGRPLQIHFVLFDLLRHEQALAAQSQPAGRTEVSRILDLAQGAYGELVGLLIGRDDGLLETARDGEWSLRDLLRHAIAVELRYAAQVEWSATRRDDQPLAIPDERLPCDRLSPPEADFRDSRTGGVARMLELLGDARSRSDRTVDVIPDTALERPSLWGQRTMTVRMRLHQTAAHLTEVTIQAEKCLVTEPGTEVRRILRHVSSVRGAHERRSPPHDRAELDARYRGLAAAIEAGPT